MKIALYSTDTFGLGHISRNWKIANTLLKIKGSDNIECLLLTSSDAFWRMVAPIKGIDFVKLPSQISIRSSEFRKTHQPKFLSMTSSNEIKELRSNLIKTTLQAYSPDLFIVDYSATGTRDELLPTLKYLQTRRKKTRIALAYRDIIGSAEYTAESWYNHNTLEVLEEFYDHILIFGDPKIFDLPNIYNLPRELHDKVTWMGYLVGRNGISQSDTKRGILITIGGGSDGFNVLREILDQIDIHSKNIPISIILGPDIPQSQSAIDEIRSRYSSWDVDIFNYIYPVIDLMQKSSICISMAGYNTMCEVISTDTLSYIIPRNSNQKEQLMRAELFSANNLSIHMNYSDLETIDFSKAIDYGAIREIRSAFLRRQQELSQDGFHSIL